MTSSGTIRRSARTALGGLAALGCAVLFLASPAAALPKLPSVTTPTVPTLPTLPPPPTVPAVPSLPGIGGLPVVSVPVDVPLPVDLATPLSSAAVPGLDGLPVPLPLADGLESSATADGQQLAPAGSAAPPAEGSPSPPSTGLVGRPGTDRNRQATRCFLTVSGGIAYPYECSAATRQHVTSETKRTEQSSNRVEVAGISLARTGAAVLTLLVAAAILLLAGVSLLRLRRRLGDRTSAS